MSSYLPYFIEKAADEKRVPLDVHFELTNTCNHACVMCYVADKDRGMDTRQVITILDELAAEGCLFLTLSGGEIFSRADILTIIDHAACKGFVITLKTNGTLLTEDIIERSAGLGVYEIHISLHAASPEIQDNITGVPGSFDRAVRAISQCVKAGLKVQIMTVLTRGHLDELTKVQKLAHELGAKEVVATTYMYGRTDGDRKPFEYQLTDAELKDYYRMAVEDPKTPQPYCRFNEDPRLIDMSTDPNDPLSYLPLEDRESDLPISCALIRRGVAIRPNGDVLPCTSLPIVLGNILNERLYDIVRSRQADQVLDMIRLKNNRKCMGCDDRIGCLRCPGLAYMEHGDARLAPSEGCRQTAIYKEVLSETGRK